MRTIKQKLARDGLVPASAIGTRRECVAGGISLLGQQASGEALAFRDSLDLERDRID
jgi:hypothetical protein